jgi:predicted Rossmann fold nucleotide-binding protein DprA/Smf involved in DNA uptake
LEQGRDLWVAKSGASEGIYSPMRGGTRKLVEEGAPVVSSACEILKEWGVYAEK